jgi:hypothetical protein
MGLSVGFLIDHVRVENSIVMNPSEFCEQLSNELTTLSICRQRQEESRGETQELKDKKQTVRLALSRRRQDARERQCHGLSLGA